MPLGFMGNFDKYSFLDIENEVLEAFSGEHYIISVRMRGPHKQYGVIRYFQLPDASIKVYEIKAIKRNFYDDLIDKIDEWVFIYLLIENKILCMIFKCEEIISQTVNIKQVRLETIPLQGKEFDFERDIPEIEQVIFGVVANIDSRLAENDPNFDPNDFVYATEINSEMKSYNPFIIPEKDSSSA